MTQPAAAAIGTRARPREQWAWPWSTIVLRQQAARIAELEAENEELRDDRQKVLNDLARLSQAYNERGDRCAELIAAHRSRHRDFIDEVAANRDLHEQLDGLGARFAARIAELERQYDLAKITIELQKARLATLETENDRLHEVLGGGDD